MDALSPQAPHALSADRALRERHARRRRRPPPLLGAMRQSRTASRSCSSTAVPEADRAPITGGSSIPTNTRSWCSTSVAAASRRPMRALRTTRPGTWSKTSKSCGRKSPRSTNGRCSAAAGARPSRSLTPQTHPERVTELVLRGIFLFDQDEIDWMYTAGGASQVYPDKFDEFIGRFPKSERGDLVEAYRKRLTSDDKDVQLDAAKAWSKWEGEIVTLLPSPDDDRAFHQPRRRHRRRADRKSLHGEPRLARGRPAAAGRGRSSRVFPA